MHSLKFWMAYIDEEEYFNNRINQIMYNSLKTSGWNFIVSQETQEMRKGVICQGYQHSKTERKRIDLKNRIMPAPLSWLLHNGPWATETQKHLPKVSDSCASIPCHLFSCFEVRETHIPRVAPSTLLFQFRIICLEYKIFISCDFVTPNIYSPGWMHLLHILQLMEVNRIHRAILKTG